MTTTSKIIDNLVVIMLNISLWQGRKKLRAEDLEEKGIATSQLPPEKLASLGSKRIIAPEAVNVFMALKRRAERACLAAGSRFLGGYAIPEERMAWLQAELESISQEFNEAKAQFISQYETTVNCWADENPEWREAIMRAVDSPTHVAAQLQCGFTALKINPVKGAESTLDNQVNGLKGQLEREIAQAAKVAWEEAFQGKLSVRKSALNKLESIAEKLDGLSFLDAQIGVLHQTVETVLKQCRGKSPIEGSDLMAINGVLATLLGLDHTRFNSEVEAATQAATPPEEPKVAPQTEEADAFTDLFGGEAVQAAASPTKPAIRVNGESWENDDLPFGGEDAVIPSGPVADMPQAAKPVAFEPPTEWF